jgi:Arc/MetJ-type ribon-helix-helix transcriptional regulator
MTPPQNSSARFAAAAKRTRRPVPKPAPATAAQRKYTVLLDSELADDFDGSLLHFRRQVGRRVDKSEVIRELISLFNEDPTLAEQIAGRRQGADGQASA